VSWCWCWHRFRGQWEPHLAALSRWLASILLYGSNVAYGRNGMWAMGRAWVCRPSRTHLRCLPCKNTDTSRLPRAYEVLKGKGCGRPLDASECVPALGREQSRQAAQLGPLMWESTYARQERGNVQGTCCAEHVDMQAYIAERSACCIRHVDLGEGSERPRGVHRGTGK